MAATVEVFLPQGPRIELGELFTLLAELGATEIELSDRESPPVLIALFPHADPNVIGGAVADLVGRTGVQPDRIEARVPESLDAGSTWRGRLKPLSIGPLVVVPAGRTPVAREPGRYVLELDASGAFGSGLHPTTAMCLERLVELSPVESLLDVGAGTGILALAGLVLGADRAVATDTDPAALAQTYANAARNGFSVAATLAELSADTRLVVTDQGFADLGAQFSLTVVNIATATLYELARDLVRVIGPRGVLLLSGLRDHEIADVGRVYRDLGLRKVGQDARDGWGLVELEASW
ncbi:50S ribosomal protein L11 methyltransferase [Myxococcota bacterium]|nr:50S ribosomal protein L11 methyltransferase [Myxococcota bacterium]